MTKEEYEMKLNLIMTSDASPDVKEEALKKLYMKHSGSTERAMLLIMESAPDQLRGDEI